MNLKRLMEDPEYYEECKRKFQEENAKHEPAPSIYRFDEGEIKKELDALLSHNMLRLNVIQTMDDLRTFMETHVYCVWDFMSLLKSIQENIAPAGPIWFQPTSPRECVRFINDIVIAEESDVAPDGTYMSHFELYISAMKEVGADYSTPLQYVNGLERFIVEVIERDGHFGLNTLKEYHKNIRGGKYDFCVPEPALEFVEYTHSVSMSENLIAQVATFLYGREDIIPAMFKYVLRQLEVNELDAPHMHYYLERHIELDGDEHGPMGHKLLEAVVGHEPINVFAAQQFAVKAINARIKLWDALEQELK